MKSKEVNAASILAVQRYRRVKTIVNKAVDVAEKFGLHLNIIVYDPKFHRLKESYTSSEIKLESIHLLADSVPNTSLSKNKLRRLKFQSVNARSKEILQEDLPEMSMPLFKLVKDS